MKSKNPGRKPRIVTPLAAPIVDPELQLDFPLDEHDIRRMVREALEEDRAFKDVTTIATVLSDRRARATLVARQNGIVAGIPFAWRPSGSRSNRTFVMSRRRRVIPISPSSTSSVTTRHALGRARRVNFSSGCRVSPVYAPLRGCRRGPARDSRHAKDDAACSRWRILLSVRRRAEHRCTSLVPCCQVNTSPRGRDIRAASGGPAFGARRRQDRVSATRWSVEPRRGCLSRHLLLDT